ncbi:MAG: hypothetical protein KDJ17_03695 [Hyphomicrobiaceae bacterium]|nr:hypothetical protein [Hyphomicrobiaceae bacterium]
MKSKIKRAPWPVLLLIASFLCPTELSLYIAGLRFPPHRVALFILFPIAILRLASQNGLKVRGFDIFFILFNVWTVAIYMYHEGGQPGLVYGGSQALESLGGYLVARAWIRNEMELRATLKALGWAIFFAAMIALPETLLGQIFTHNILHQLTGYYHPIGVEQRLGLTRAYGVFDHPIHYGTFCATMAAMFWFAERTTAARFKKAGLLTAATVLGLSSAPLLCLGLQGGMLAWDKITRGFKARAKITLLIIVGLYIGASLVSTRGPIAIMATSMTLDPWTGFYRLQIWENGMNNVWMYPLTGLGLGEWERPDWMFSSTIDAFWLVIMIRTGLPALLLLVISLTLLFRAVNKRGLKSKDPKLRNMARGWTMSLIALSMVATTVHLWNVPFTFFFFFLGTAGWIADPVRVRVKAKKPATSKQDAMPGFPAPAPGGLAAPYPPRPMMPHGAYA